jgi:hypothetical protein
MKKAIVALARRLAVIMHRIWVDGTESREQATAAAASFSRSKISCRFDRGPIQYALETDWLAGHIGLEPAYLSSRYLIGIA